MARSNYDVGTNNTTAALADVQKALQLDPSRSDSYLNLGMLQMRGQQFDAAEANFKKAVDLTPKSTNALTFAGKLLSDARTLSRGRANGSGAP